MRSDAIVPVGFVMKGEVGIATEGAPGPVVVGAVAAGGGGRCA